MKIREKAFSAVRWTSVASFARGAIQFAQIAILARLLLPDDFGLMAVVSVVLALTISFSDLGVNQAFVQRQTVSEEHRSSLFFFNLCVGTVVASLLFFSSSLMATLFGDQRLSPLFEAISPVFVITALGQQIRMSAEKALDFGSVVKVEVISLLFGLGAAVYGAVNGWGVFALVASAVVASFMNTLLLWLFLSHGWVPALRLKIEEVREYLGFGGSSVSARLVNEINTNVDLLLGGRMLDASVLGLYSVPRAMLLRIQALVNPVVTRVGFPLIAKVQHDRDKVRSIYLKTVVMTSTMIAPIYIGTAFFAESIIRIVLGDKWLESTDLLRILAVWALLRSSLNPVGSLLLGMGRANLALKWNLGLLIVVPPALYIASSYGANGLAWALLGISAFVYIPGWHFLVRPICEISFADYAVASFKPAVLAAMATLPSYAVSTLVTNPWAKLSIGVLLTSVLYFLLNYKFNRTTLTYGFEVLKWRT